MARIDARQRRRLAEPAPAAPPHAPSLRSVSAPAAPGSGPERPAPGAVRAVTLGHLPGPVLASVGMPRAEVAVFVVLAPLLSAPVLLATMGAAWVAGGALAVTAVVAWVCGARRVAVGDGWVADRRLWRYRVTSAAQLRAVELLDTAHGGVLRLSPHTGRPHRLRRTEFDRPDVRAALGGLLSAGTPAVGPGVRQALALPPAS